MDQSTRKQIRRVIEDEDARARCAVKDRLKEIYADFAARGELESDLARIAALEALEELSAQFIWGCASKVRVISAGSEALATYRGGSAF